MLTSAQDQCEAELILFQPREPAWGRGVPGRAGRNGALWPGKGLSPQLCATQATAELKVGMSFAVSGISGILGIHSFK